MFILKKSMEIKPVSGELTKSKLNISLSVLKKAYDFALANGKDATDDQVVTLHVSQDGAMIYYGVSKTHESEEIDITNYDLF